MAFFDAQGIPDLPLEPRNRPAFEMRPLHGVERPARLFDDRPIHAQVDRALPIAVAERESIVGTESFSVPGAVRRGDMSAPGEDIGSRRNPSQRGMFELVSAFGIFQFRSLFLFFPSLGVYAWEQSDKNIGLSGPFTDLVFRR